MDAAERRREEVEQELRKSRSGVDRVRFVALLALHACGRLESAGEAIEALARFLVNPMAYASSSSSRSVPGRSGGTTEGRALEGTLRSTTSGTNDQ